MDVRLHSGLLDFETTVRRSSFHKNSLEGECYCDLLIYMEQTHCLCQGLLYTIVSHLLSPNLSKFVYTTMIKRLTRV